MSSKTRFKTNPGRRVKAMAKGTCPACRKSIVIGQTIEQVGKQWLHVGCVSPAQVTPAPAQVTPPVAAPIADYTVRLTTAQGIKGGPWVIGAGFSAFGYPTEEAAQQEATRRKQKYDARQLVIMRVIAGLSLRFDLPITSGATKTDKARYAEPLLSTIDRIKGGTYQPVEVLRLLDRANADAFPLVERMLDRMLARQTEMERAQGTALVVNFQGFNKPDSYTAVKLKKEAADLRASGDLVSQDPITNRKAIDIHYRMSALLAKYVNTQLEAMMNEGARQHGVALRTNRRQGRVSRRNPWTEQLTDPKTGKSRIVEFMTLSGPAGDAELFRFPGEPTWKYHVPTLDMIVDVGSGSLNELQRSVHERVRGKLASYPSKMAEEPKPKELPLWRRQKRTIQKSRLPKPQKSLLDMVRIPGDRRGIIEETGEPYSLKPYELARTETTQAQWMAVMGGISPSEHRESLEQPVENVDWYQAEAFASRLSDLEGLTGESRYRLPTEAEWEYAARGGEAFEYAGSDDPDEVAWTSRNSGEKSHPVGRLKANGYGLFDMSGNVWEWTSTKQGSYRVNRGGSWDNDPRNARVAIRGGYGPGLRDDDLGFRLARSLRK